MTIRDTIDPSPTSRFQLRVVAICLVLNMIDGFDLLAMAFTASSVASELSLTGVQVGVLLSSALVGMVVGSATIAPLADNIGRRPLTLICLAISTIGMVAAAAAPGFIGLGIARLITGLGIGGLIANLPVLVAEFSPRRRQGTTVALYAAGLPLGGVVGGSVAAAVTSEFGWRAVFVVGALLTASMLLLCIRAMPESLDYLLARRRPDALERINQLLGRMGLAAIDALPSLGRSREDGGVRGDILRGRNGLRSVLLWIAFFVMMASFYFAASWTPQLLEQSGFSAEQGINGGVLLNVGGVVAALIFSALAVVVASRALTVVSLLATVVAFVSMSLVLDGTASMILLVAFTVGMFINANVVGFFATVPGLYPAAVRTTAVGWANGFGRLGGIVAPVLAGALLDLDWTPPGLFVLFAVPLALAAAVMWLATSSWLQDDTTVSGGVSGVHIGDEEQGESTPPAGSGALRSQKDPTPRREEST